MKKKRIFVLGYFGYFSNQIDGQTIKTRNVYDLLKTKSVNTSLTYFDTDLYKKSKFLLLKSIYLLITSDICVYLPGKKNLTFLFPVFFVFARLFSVKLIYPVVGGWLPDYLKCHSLQRKMLNPVIMLVESNHMKQRLISEYAFRNVECFPNFRIHNFNQLPDRKQTYDNNLKIVFMSRIMIDKGVDVIFRFIDYIQEKEQNKHFQISFFGPIIDRDFFKEKLEHYPMVSYNGILEQEDIYKTLSLYDVLVLPTRYKGEGFPGAIIDAYISGIPVISSNWKYLEEFVDNGKTGYVYNWQNEVEFYELLLNLINKPFLLPELKRNAVNESKKYTPEKAWSILEPIVR